MGTVARTCRECGSAFQAEQRNIDNGFGNFCSRSCSTINFKRSRYEPIEQRIWKFVKKNDPSEPDGCWEWTGGTSRGYGTIREGNGSKSNILAHRLSYEICYGKIPDGNYVCHTCDNKLCVRPDHLFAGTAQDNMSDKVKKGRQRKGESVPQSKLTAESVREIRRIFSGGGIYQKDLAVMFGVNKSNISKIIRNEIWGHPDYATENPLPTNGNSK